MSNPFIGSVVLYLENAGDPPLAAIVTGYMEQAGPTVLALAVLKPGETAVTPVSAPHALSLTPGCWSFTE